MTGLGYNPYPHNAGVQTKFFHKILDELLDFLRVHISNGGLIIYKHCVKVAGATFCKTKLHLEK